MMMKSLMACACAVIPLCRAVEAAPDVAPQSAVGMTFTFSPATEEQTTARATAKGDIPHPASGTCTITKSMPGASRSHGGIRFTVKQR